MNTTAGTRFSRRAASVFSPIPRCAADYGREEAYKKGVFNQLMTHLAVTYAKEAACTDGAASAELYSKAAAVYGNPFVDSASIGATPQTTANRRCKNFDTCVTTDYLEGAGGPWGLWPGLQLSGLNYQAATNVAIMNAFLEATPANVEIIKEQIKVTYIQAGLRYLNKVDKDLVADPPTMGSVREHQGEGWAYVLVARSFLSAGTFAVVEGLYTTAIDMTGPSATCALLVWITRGRSRGRS